MISIETQTSAVEDGQYQARARVLLVEDNKLALVAAKSKLESLECHVKSAMTGELAIEKFKKEDFDMVIIDIGLPDISGIECAKIMRGIPEKYHIPIVALTAHTDQNIREQALAAGMNMVLTKPISVESAVEVFQLCLPKLIIDTSDKALDLGSNKQLESFLVQLPSIRAKISEDFKAQDKSSFLMLLRSLQEQLATLNVPHLEMTIGTILYLYDANMASDETIKELQQELLNEIDKLLPETA